MISEGELTEPSFCSSGARPGRTNDETFAEALHTVHEIQSLSSDPTTSGVTTRVEGMLMKWLEKADNELNEEKGDDASLQSSTPESATSTSSLLAGIASPRRPVRYELEGDESAENSSSSGSIFVGWNLFCSGFRNCELGCLLHEAFQLLVVSPLLLVVVVDAPSSALTTSRMLILPLYTYVVARLVVLAIKRLLSSYLRDLQAEDRIALLCRSALGWPATILLCVALGLLCAALGIDDSLWHSLLDFPHYWPICFWLVGAATTRPLLEVFAKTYMCELTLRHYGARAHTAHAAQQLLRLIVAAVTSEQERAASKLAEHAASHATGPGGQHERPSSRPRPLGSLDSTEEAMLLDQSGQPPTSSPRVQDESARDKSEQPWAAFCAQVSSLSGPLEFGSGMEKAADLAQARHHATRLYERLKSMEALQSEGDGGGISRRKLLEWSGMYSGSELDPVGEGALLCLDENMTEDKFVSSIERCYKESRLLIASISSYEKINHLFYRACVWIWRLVLIIVFAVVWQGRYITLWIIPSVSVVASLVVILGKAPGDVMSGAIYTILLRPFDIGDRVVLSHPGRDPVLYSLLVKEIDVIRTHFLTCNGELLLIENHLLRDMCITNLSRSGQPTLMIRLQVPAATPATKVSELVDAIKMYIENNDADWLAVDQMFSSTDFSSGHLNLDIWPTCKHLAAEVELVYSAKSSLLIFIHAYMQSANIEYIKPLAPTKIQATWPKLESAILDGPTEV